MSASTFRAGYFYPLDVDRALSLAHGSAYIRRCAYRALREPMSARRVSDDALRRARRRVANLRPAMPP